jgi:hypothetical protein
LRRLFLIPLAISLLAAAMPVATLAAVPDGYRVISYRHAEGYVASADGCVLTEAYFGSTAAKYGGRPGPINKQAGPTDVLLIVSDVCAEPVGKGYPKLAVWQGQAMVGLGSTAQFDRAWVQAAIPVHDDVSGADSFAVIDLSWVSTERAVIDPSHYHERFPGIAVVNSHDNDTMVAATVTGTMEIGEIGLEISSSDALLSSVKAGCQVMTHPGVENPDIACI